MAYIDRDGKKHEEKDGQDKLISLLYTTLPGRLLLAPLVHPWVSRLAGMLLDEPLSRCLIGPFIRQTHLDMEPFQKKRPDEFRSYNDFFTRKLKPGMRPAQEKPDCLYSPCDGKATVCPINRKTRFYVKNTEYSVASLLKNESLARRYEGGCAVILRLCVTDYHRYRYAVSGRKSSNRKIPGIFHTVNPIAVERAAVFHENTREYTLIRNPHFGTVLQMEVGALLVGRICNCREAGWVKAEEEKGRFEFGGSTIILLFQKGSIDLREDLKKNTADGYETEVHMGELLGEENRTKTSIKNT